MDKKTKIYITIVGMHFYYGQGFLEPGMKVRLEKEPNNKYDNEAIFVALDGLGKIGYVANSVNTVLGESSSAGRIYDSFDEKTFAKVKYVLDDGAICELDV